MTADWRSARRESRRRRGRLLALVVVVVLIAAGAGGWWWWTNRDDEPARSARTGETSSTAAASASTVTEPTTTTAPPPPPFDGWVDPASAGKPWGEVPGSLTFRGNPTRTWYGTGPVPTAPSVQWTFTIGCSESSEGASVSSWCGTGWTGQPAVFERDGRTWVVFGAYDRSVHFLDAATGERILPDFPTGDIIKGSVTVDPDGFPLVYTGSRDNRYRVLAIDGPEAVELWGLDANAVSPVMWNNDWDGSGLVIDDYLFEGGENSQIHIAKLNRGYDPAGRVTVAPELVWNAPGWDDELLGGVGDSDVSIENSVAIWGNTLYFANSGGLVQGWDIGGLRTGAGEPVRTFRFWTGDDTDASVVVDEEGFLYVGSEWERHTAQASEVGQVMKLDPRNTDNPVVWAVKDQDTDPAGVWATAGLVGDLVIVPTNSGRILGIDRATGAIRWEKHLPGPTWQSPVIVDGVWIQGDCNGMLHAYDVSDTLVEPPELWSVELGGCIESTPTMWKGRLYVGTRNGTFFAVGDG